MIQSKEKINGKEVTIRVYKGNSSRTDSDRAMDYRATQAVKAAIKKAKVCGAPVAKYDAEAQKAYLEYADGRREYAE